MHKQHAVKAKNKQPRTRQPMNLNRQKKFTIGCIILIVAVLGVYLLVPSHAATPYAGVAADGGTLDGSAQLETDTSGQTFNGQYVAFNAPVTGNGACSAQTSEIMSDVCKMLANQVNHGWDPCYKGEAINWNEVNGQTVYNYAGTGVPDTCTNGVPQRPEDRLTTLRFLHSLLLYDSVTKSDEYATEIEKVVDPHVVGLYTTTDKRGWVYDEMEQIAALEAASDVPAIKADAAEFYTLGSAELKSFYDSLAPYYQYNFQIEEASALVQSGITNLDGDNYVAKGEADLNTLWQCDGLSLPTPTGPADLIVPPPIPTNTAGASDMCPPANVNGSMVDFVTSDEVDLAIALARAYNPNDSTTAIYKTQANELLAGINYYLQDTTPGDDGGWYEGAYYTFASKSFAVQTKKTGGRMMNTLELAELLNDTPLETTMDNLFLNYIYQSSPTGYEGVLYEQNDQWQAYDNLGPSQNVLENWVTSEAMGITMIALMMQSNLQ